MKLSVAWIDRETANITNISGEAMERKKLKGKHRDHHTHRRDSLDHGREEKSLFLEAVASLVDSDQILIVGPGVAKHHFQAFLVEQHPLIAKKIIGIETVDHPSDGQIAALAKKYYAKAIA